MNHSRSLESSFKTLPKADNLVAETYILMGPGIVKATHPHIIISSAHTLSGPALAPSGPPLFQILLHIASPACYILTVKIAL